MGRLTHRRLSPREIAALNNEHGRNAYHEAKMAGKSEREAREMALEAYDDRCVYCGGSGVRCCEFGRERR